MMKAKTRKKNREIAKLAGQLNHRCKTVKSPQAIKADKESLGIISCSSSDVGGRCEFCTYHQANGWCMGHPIAIKTSRNEFCAKYKSHSPIKVVSGGLVRPN